MIAKASAGKGHLGLCKELVKINKAQQLLIPANSSATAMYRQLWENDGNGLIFETEADTLNYAIKSNYGNFSGGLRKAFHHETINYLRRKENEWIEIEEPHLSIVLSGTPLQSRRLIPSAENGLFSRFAILNLNNRSQWKNVFDSSELSYRAKYHELSYRLLSLYNRLMLCDTPIEFKLSTAQKEQFNNHFDMIHSCLTNDENFTASIRRMGVIAYRVAMILSALRLEKADVLPTTIECSEEDFHVALTISESLLDHAMAHYQTLPEGAISGNYCERKRQQKETLLQMMPTEFSRKELLAASQTMNISSRTIDNYIREYLDDNEIENISFGVFRKQKNMELGKTA